MKGINNSNYPTAERQRKFSIKYKNVQNNPLKFIDPEGTSEVQVEAGTPLNLEYAIKDISAWENFQYMQILIMFQKNEMIYYLYNENYLGQVTIDYGDNVEVIAKEGSFQDWWYKFKSGYYWGTGYGQGAMEYYANILSDPHSSWFQKTGSAAGGTFSAMWLPNTYGNTYSTFLGGATAGAIVNKQGLRLFGKFIVKINHSKHTGLMAIRRPYKSDIYVSGTKNLAKILFKRLF